MEALSRTLLEKMAGLQEENEKLREALDLLESGVAADVNRLVLDLNSVKEQVKLVTEQVGPSSRLIALGSW